MAYKGVVVSLNPRKTPCIANERRTAGAPRDLNFRYCCAGCNIGESCLIIIYIILQSSLADTIRGQITKVKHKCWSAINQRISLLVFIQKYLQKLLP